MSEKLEIEFNRNVARNIDELKSLLNYRPTRFIQMVANSGGLQAVKQLLRGSDASDGFTKLWEAKRLDLSMEALAVLPNYSNLFTNDEKDKARYRLEAYGFDLAEFLRRHN